MRTRITIESKELDKLIGDVKTRHFSPNQVINKFIPIAQNLAPVATDSRGGGTKKAIMGIRSGDDSFAILRLAQPRVRSPLREYHLWMHALGDYDISSYIKNNKGMFMFRVAEEMADYVNTNATKEYSF